MKHFDNADVSRPAAFLDRDGTLIEEVGYLANLADVRLLPGAAEAVRTLNAAGLSVVVVTNQSGVARGYFDEVHVRATHELIRSLLAEQGASIDHFDYSPFHPTDGIDDYRRDTDCRKPGAGMLLRSAAALHLDLARSWMIGDRPSDLEAGRNAGCRSILVRTGYGSAVDLAAYPYAEDAPDLRAAVELIVAGSFA